MILNEKSELIGLEGRKKKMFVIACQTCVYTSVNNAESRCSYNYYQTIVQIIRYGHIKTIINQNNHCDDHIKWPNSTQYFHCYKYLHLQ